MAHLKRIVPLTSLLALMILALLPGQASARQAVGPALEPACPTVIQKGEITVTIPAGETSGTVEQPITRCAGMNVQVTGGTLNRTPAIVNAIVHQNRLLLSVHLLAPQPGPTDFTIWWRVDS
jgi:hypothetical protein